MRQKKTQKSVNEDILLTESEAVSEAVKEKSTEEVKAEKILIAVVNAPLNFREAPNTDAKVLAVLQAGTEVSVENIKNNKDWYLCHLEDGDAYAMKKFISLK